VAEFTLDVRDMPDGVSEHGFEVRPAWLDEQLSDIEGIGAAEAPGKVVLEATKQGKQVLLHGTVEAPLKLTCVRCLGAFDASAQAQVSVIMRPRRPAEAKKGEELGLDELNEESYQGDVITLDELVRDLLLLEVPVNPRCGESCPGWDSLTDRASTE
jgi:uncharacterized protein